MKHAFLAAACVLGACAVAGGHAQADVVQLQVSKTANPGEVRLSWSGGVPSYTIYRSDIAAMILDAGSQLTVTDELEFLDTPPGSIAFFFIESPCLAVPPDVCCLNDGYCLSSEFCDFETSLCAPKKNQGASCAGPNECQSNFCVDGLCCSSLCSGTCSACDVVAPPGTCGPVPGGTDPDTECGGVSCDGFYYGFVGDTCFRKADVTDAQASCNGSGACRTPAEECSAQTSQGPGTLICNALCQDPTPGTCTGTIPGLCTNVNPGTQTCGIGACQTTVNQCVNGMPNTCVPGLPTTETCNDIDDNCDGTVDNGAFSDALEPNASCPGATLTAVTDLSGPRTVNPTLYGSGDVDVFTIPVAQAGPTCECCDETCDFEEFRLSVSLTVPTGAGSYEVCLPPSPGTSCTGTWTNCSTVAAGNTGTVNLFLGGSCFVTESTQVYVRVRGIGAPGFECRTYTLQYSFALVDCHGPQ